MFEFALASVMWSLDWGWARRVPNASITINWHRFKLHVNLHFNFAHIKVELQTEKHRNRQSTKWVFTNLCEPEFDSTLTKLGYTVTEKHTDKDTNTKTEKHKKQHT